MKLWQAEKEAFDAMNEAKTLSDYVRIGFNAVRYGDYVLHEMMGDDKVGGIEYLSDGGVKQVVIDGSEEVVLCDFTTDDNGYHVIEVKKGE